MLNWFKRGFKGSKTPSSEPPQMLTPERRKIRHITILAEPGIGDNEVFLVHELFEATDTALKLNGALLDWTARQVLFSPESVPRFASQADRNAYVDKRFSSPLQAYTVDMSSRRQVVTVVIEYHTA